MPRFEKLSPLAEEPTYNRQAGGRVHTEEGESMPRFAVSVTDHVATPPDPLRAQKCKCKCTAIFEVSVTERDLGPAQSHGAQKCKCKCPCKCLSSPSALGPWTEMRAESGSLQLSPLGD
jgi:hypothetical protein